jgi:hypothetical protein
MITVLTNDLLNECTWAWTLMWPGPGKNKMESWGKERRRKEQRFME